MVLYKHTFKLIALFDFDKQHGEMPNVISIVQKSQYQVEDKYPFPIWPSWNNSFHNKKQLVP